MKPIELNDILTYKFLSGVRYAPGGRRAAFVVANANEEENTYERRLWLYEDGKVRQLTDVGKEGGFFWLDDERLMFPAMRSEKEKKRAKDKEEFTSYYVLDLRGGEALPLFEVPFAVDGLRVLDGTHFAVNASTDKLHPELWSASQEDREKVKKERDEDKDYEVLDELPFWGNGAGVINGSRGRLFLVSLDPKKVEPVTELPDDLLDMAIMGDEVVYAVNRREARLSIRGFALRAVNWKTGKRARCWKTTRCASAACRARADGSGSLRRRAGASD